MNVYRITDLSDAKVVAILQAGLSEVDNAQAINYHPDYANRPENVFYLLKQGRYREGKGTYFIIEENGEYICSAGWNEYTRNTALALTRMYTASKYRMQYFVAKNILVKTLEETKQYNNIWLTVNERNKTLYNWFVRKEQNKRSALFNDWPEIYKKFKPIGKKNVYGITQYVVELQRNYMNDEEKIDFIREAIFAISKRNIKISPQDVLLDIGLDSLDTVELQMYYEENTGHEISDDVVIVTVSDLMKVMK
jgi:acyl carrier protein